MTQKKFALVFTSVLLALFLLTTASALVVSSNAQTFDRVGQSQSITITGDGNFNIVFPTSTYFSFSPSTITGASSAVVNVTLTSMPLSVIGEGTFSITASNSSNSSYIDTFDLTYVKSFCSSGPLNATDLDLEVSINNLGEGDDHDWKPLDTIEVEVELNNDLNTDLNDVVFKIGLYEAGTNTNIIDNMIWISEDDEEAEVGDVDEGESSDKYTFEFKVDPSEVDSNVDDYYLVVKAFPDGDESQTCVDSSSDLSSSDFGQSPYFATISITSETDSDKSVIVDIDEVQSVNAQCNEDVTFNVDVWNIGDEDYEDQILVRAYNQELGINQNVTVLGDFDSGDKEEVSFTFAVPSGAAERQYNIIMDVFYDYSSSGDRYRESSEDSFIIPLVVQGNCVNSQASVSATLESGGKAGEDLVVKARITNTGSSTATYLVSLDDYSDWASSAQVSSSSMTLNPGQSRDVSATFNVNPDTASGDYTFNLELISNGRTVLSQPVQVEVDGNGVSGKNFKDLIVPILIGLISLVIIAIIIVLIVNAVRKKDE